MESTEGSETSAFRTQTPGNYPKENILIIVFSTCFEHPSVHPQEDLYMQVYGTSLMNPYKYSGRWQDMIENQAHPVYTDA